MRTPIVLLLLVAGALACGRGKSSRGGDAEPAPDEGNGTVVPVGDGGSGGGGDSGGRGSDDLIVKGPGPVDAGGTDDADDTPAGFKLGGEVTRLVGKLVLKSRTGETLKLTASGRFAFRTRLADGDAYDVTIASQPAGQSCALTASTGAGTVAGAHIDTVRIACDYVPATPDCDPGFALDSQDATEAARAFGVCDGLSAARWALPDGTVMATAPVVDITTEPDFHLGHGLSPDFGANTQPRQGASLVVLSTGTARTPSQPGFVSPVSSALNKGYQHGLPRVSGLLSTGDEGYTPGACDAVSADAHDGIALILTLTVPPGANAFTFDYAFLASDFPQWMCRSFTDQMVVLVTTPATANANVALSDRGKPINVNTRNLDACAAGNPPYPCAQGTGFLQGSGFDGAAATGWRRSTTTSVSPGQTVTLRAMIWDADDGIGDSTVLLDNFRWLAQ